MKQTIAFIMALAMLACTLSMTSFAADIEYPVDDVSSNFYVLDDDNDLRLDQGSASKVSYGKTAYFPLLNAASSVVSEKKKAWDEAEKALTTAQSAYTKANNDYISLKDKLDDYIEKARLATEKEAAWKYYNDHLPTLEQAVTAAQSVLDAAELDRNTKKQEYETALGVYNEKKAIWEAITPTVDSGPEWDAYKDAELVMNEKKTPYETAEDLVTQKTTELNVAKQNVTDLGNPTTLEQNKNTAYNNKALAQAALFTATGTSDVTAAEQKVDDAETAKITAQTNVTNKTKTRDDAKKAYEIAFDAGDYPYVYEPDAIKSMRVTESWEEGKPYVTDVDVVKKKVDGTVKGATTSSMRYIYFLTVKIKSASSTQSRDVLGTVKLKKSGSDGFEITADINLEIGFSSASDTDAGEGVISSTPATFKEGDGFEEEDDFRFDFEDDSDSYFEVDTNGQGSIVLSFDTEPDDDLLDEYPNADMWFYNGNYASFNRIGNLYLSYPDDDGYVYEVSKSGQLTRIDPEYDEVEEAYQIRTRTLGRYVISKTKLKTTSSSSSSSSSSGTGTGTGTGTGGTGAAVVPTAPSTPSYTYTPPAASSSTAPPVQSSSSEPEEEEESESESEPEELEDEDDIVDVVIDDKEAEGPDEKSGIPAWVWAMIIVGLAAIPIGIGIVYYLHSRPLRRDFFNEDEDEYYDDDKD